jgi:hypothetical protein
MNVDNLRERYPELITYMQIAGYSRTYIYKVQSEIKRVLAGADEKRWRSYSDIYQEYAEKLESQQTLRNKRTFLGLIEHFDTYGLYPDGRRRQKIVQRATYHMLTDEYKAVIDYYGAVERKRGKKDTTIYGEASHASTFAIYASAG